MKSYSCYEAMDFAMDSDFQDWVFRKEKEAYWRTIIESYPEKEAAIKEARRILKSVAFKEEFPPKEVVDEHLTRTLKKIEKHDRGRVVALHNRWAAAAVVILVSISVFYLIKPKSHGDRLQVVQQNDPHDISPGGNRAVLVLADGSQVLLDSIANGMITQQGGVKVIKLKSGELAYDFSGGDAQSVSYNSIRTPRGGQYQITLADGSRVWLNSMSSIRFPTSFHGNERIVEITGEAYFEVAKDASRPFHVKAENLDVEVLGTHFNISAYSDDESLKTTLLEGSVKVSNGNANVTLKPGQQVGALSKGGGLGKVKTADLAEVMAWKNHEFLFNETGLGDALRELSRWYDFEPVVEGNISPTYLYGSISRDKKLSEVLKIMEATGLQFRIEKSGSTNRLIVLK